jgi:hypothetical protein
LPGDARNARTEVHEYTRKLDWLDMMSITFGIDKDVLEEAIDFLDLLGGQFAKRLDSCKLTPTKS